jgi:hypothetical protein
MKVFLFGIYILATPSFAYAYLDPGNASLILQAVIAGMAGVIGVYAALKNKIKEFLKNLFKK